MIGKLVIAVFAALGTVVLLALIGVALAKEIFVPARRQTLDLQFPKGFEWPLATNSTAPTNVPKVEVQNR